MTTLTDDPAGVSPVLAEAVEALSGRVEGRQRQRLVQYAPRLLGTAGRPDLDRLAAFVAVDHAVRVSAPAALRGGGWEAFADQLAGLAEITNGAKASWAASDAVHVASLVATHYDAVVPVVYHAADAAASAFMADADLSPRGFAHSAAFATTAALLAYTPPLADADPFALLDRMLAVWDQTEETP